MKKKYEKPQLYMERFELAEHIAGCSFTDNGDGTVTGWVDGTYITNGFLDGTTCNVVLEGFCYTNGSINVATMTS